MIRWFGPAKLIISQDYSQAPAPIGQACLYCQEIIVAGDTGYLVPHITQTGTHDQPHHYECWLRQIIGGINHQKQFCACFNGTLPADPPELTKRQAARAASGYYLDQLRFASIRSGQPQCN